MGFIEKFIRTFFEGNLILYKKVSDNFYGKIDILEVILILSKILIFLEILEIKF